MGVDVKDKLQNENQKMFEEIEFLHSQQQTQTGITTNSDDYDMLLEVKNNLQEENDRLNEEVDYLNENAEKERKKMQAEIEYLTEKQKSMDRKLQAERTLRISAEEELEA